ncbi:YfbM family protein [Streptomyces sp. NPDC005498]|uniref:YfbM family protein n=1 Tax=Streptomyces sp. NPDC005498 TaxID=3364717 RepID=UPI00369351E8
MSMIGEYFRVTAAELERVIQDSDWALDYIEESRDVEEEAKLSPAEARHFSTYKAWHLLDFLLQRSGFPVSVIHGEEFLGEADDWGYGPPRYLPADRVRLAADELGCLTYDRLLDGVEPHELMAAEIYPLGWEDRSSLEWGGDWFAGLAEYFAAAAHAGHAVIVWLD